MSPEGLKKLANALLKKEIKPSRIAINAFIDAVSPGREGDISIDVIFLRYDGWSLGTPMDFVENVYLTWKKEWAAKINLMDKQITWYGFQKDMQ